MVPGSQVRSWTMKALSAQTEHYNVVLYVFCGHRDLGART